MLPFWTPLIYLYLNIIAVVATNTTGLTIAYSSLLIEERVETYVYDMENLLTSIGGNLGLFLGFSCFSSILVLLEFIFKKKN